MLLVHVLARRCCRISPGDMPNYAALAISCCVAAGWSPYHLCHLLNAIKSIFGELKLGSVDILESIMSIQSLSLFGCLEIARKSGGLRQIDAPFHDETCSTLAPVLAGGNEKG